ncbi:hypothetical protein EMEDMD4_90130 [Sinorhizobium medicae]|uniref:Uncharacterized protein n=1 Tax=Sinorhizobium medicae TaxID=110321 RepID=A0A508X798_9HYPH|nr:hypothetical protein EMEDMD4_90130 [Sinorhizobium medicae]
MKAVCTEMERILARLQEQHLCVAARQTPYSKRRLTMEMLGNSLSCAIR